MTGDRVVITGADGFVGSSLVAGLRTDAPIIPLTRADADLNDTAAVRALLRPGDVVVNAAGYADVTDQSPAGEARFRRSNVDAVRSLAEAAAGANVTQLIQMSSVAAMGRWQGTGIDESFQREPPTPYARSKRDGELALRDFQDRLAVTILRPTSVFGEGRPLAAGLCRVVDRAVVPLPAFGRALVPFAYIANVVDSVRLTLANPRCYGGTFIVGDEASYPLRDILEALARGLGVRPRYIGLPAAPVRAGAWLLRRAGRSGAAVARVQTLTTSVEYSIRAFKDATGYVPPWSLADAAQRIASWYRSSEGRA